MKRKIAVLFKDLCCSQCKSDFNEDSFAIMREEDTLIAFKATCNECGKSFGVAFLGISDFTLKEDLKEDDDDLTLHIQEGPAPISENDVLDAHKFIRELDDNWKKFISKFNE